MSATADKGPKQGGYESLPVDEPFEGVFRRSFSTDRATVSRYDFEPGASFPLHRHPQEQITLIEAGAVEMTVGEETSTMAGGTWSVVPPDVDHGITAGSAGARIVAIVMPPRSAPDEYDLSRESGS